LEDRFSGPAYQCSLMEGSFLVRQRNYVENKAKVGLVLIEVKKGECENQGGGEEKTTRRETVTK